MRSSQICNEAFHLCNTFYTLFLLVYQLNMEQMRMKSNTIISTDDAKRIAKRLLNHWKHKFEVAETEENLSIFMPDATVVLTPEAQQLFVELRTDREDYRRLEQVILDHLNRMAQQEFNVQWQHQA